MKSESWLAARQRRIASEVAGAVVHNLSAIRGAVQRPLFGRKQSPLTLSHHVAQRARALGVFYFGNGPHASISLPSVRLSIAPSAPM